MGVDPEDETDVARLIPTVEVLGLSEVGVAPQGDPVEAGLAAQARSSGPRPRRLVHARAGCRCD